MVATLKKYVEAAFAFAYDSAPKAAPKKRESKRRPNQKAVALSDLTSAERAELADRLEAELARL